MENEPLRLSPTYGVVNFHNNNTVRERERIEEDDNEL
jgi:hypothetical protein